MRARMLGWREANLSRLPQRRLDADVACGRPAEAGHAADVACGRAGVRTWRAAARAGAQAVEVSLNPSRLSPSWLPPLPRSPPLFHAPPPPAGVAFHLNRRAGKHLINHPPLRRPVPNPSLPPAPPRRDAVRISCAPVRRGFVRARIDFLSAR